MGLAAQRFSSGNVSLGTPTARASYFRPVEALRRARRSDPARRTGAYMLAYARVRAEKLVAFRSSTLWAGQVTPALLAAVARRCAATTGGSALHQVPQTSRTGQPRAPSHGKQRHNCELIFLADGRVTLLKSREHGVQSAKRRTGAVEAKPALQISSCLELLELH